MGHEELGSLVCQGVAVDAKHPGLICFENKYFEKIDTCGTMELLGQFLRAYNCCREQSTLARSFKCSVAFSAFFSMALFTNRVQNMKQSTENCPEQHPPCFNYL